MSRSAASKRFSLVLLAQMCAANVALAYPIERGRRLSARVEGPIVESESRLAIDEQTVRVRCDRDEGAFRCALDATMIVRNPTGRSVVERWAFFGARVESLRVASPEDESVAIAQGESGDWDRALRRAEGFASSEDGWAAWERGFPRLQRRAIELRLLPAGELTLRVQSALVLTRRFERRVTEFDSIVPRHPIVSPRQPIRTFDVDWLCASAGDSPSVRRVVFEVDAPSNVLLEMRAIALGEDAGDPTLGRSMDGARVGGSNGRSLWRFAIAPHGSAVARLALSLTEPEPIVRRGGPLLAVGFSLDGGVTPRVFVRAGYELGLGRFVHWQSTVESSFASLDNALVVATLLEVSSPWFVRLPWLLPLSFGAGASLRVPSALPSIRAQLGVQFVGVGLVLHGDLTPWEPSFFREWGLGLRGSL